MFLGPLTEDDYLPIINSYFKLPDNDNFVGSGTSGIRLLLKSLNLKRHSRIGIPALICEDVRRAILKEKHDPILLDIDRDYLFLEYNPGKLIKDNLDCIILPHLYGILHPYTGHFRQFTHENNILLIHDAAQSYGLNYKGKSIIEFEKK